MTRQEFIEDIFTFSDLIDFCYMVDCSECDDIISWHDRNDQINESLVDRARDASSWQELRDYLDEIDTGYEWYTCDAYGEWEPLDDEDFERYKEYVLDWCDNNDVFDEDDEEEADEAADEEEIETDPYTGEIIDDSVELESEDFSLTDLFGHCVDGLQQIEAGERENEEREEAALQALLAS